MKRGPARIAVLVFPLERFRELVERHALAGLTAHHWSFMGHIDGPLVRTLETVSIPALLQGSSDRAQVSDE